MKIPCTIMRGGTSKVIIVESESLPTYIDQRDQIILQLFGSPDRRQIDGLGGADPLTSKVAIVGEPSHPDANLDYKFGQVGILEAHIDYGGYCGNISSAVAAYAVDEGFVEVTSPITKVRIHNTNTGRLILAEVPVLDGKRIEEDDFSIAGVPGTGACIKLDFTETAGSFTERLLPTGNSIDIHRMNGLEEIRFSVVDIGNTMVFVEASSFGVFTTEGPDELDKRKDLFYRVGSFRSQVAGLIGLEREGQHLSDNIAIVALVNRPADYTSFSSRKLISAESMDVWSREFFMGSIHKTYGVGETVCTAAAALITGTVVNGVARSECKDRGIVRIGHPCGVIEAEVEIENTTNGPVCKRAVVGRTARRIMDGEVYVPDLR